METITEWTKEIEASHSASKFHYIHKLAQRRFHANKSFHHKHSGLLELHQSELSMHNVAIITNMYIYADRLVAMTLVGLIKKRAVVCYSVRNKASNPDDGQTENT